MQIIHAREFEQICNHDTKIIKFGRSLEQPKIYETADDTIIKLFYPKRRRFSSDKFKPYAFRFCNNIEKLRSLGYAVPEVIKINYCPDNKIYLVFYKKMAGTDLRSYVKQHGVHVIEQVAKLVADLHQRGVFFRSIHLENLLRLDDGKIGLLDIVDMRFKSRPLSLHMRYRNIKHMFADTNDMQLWKDYGKQRFLNNYFRYAAMNKISQWILSYFVKK